MAEVAPQAECGTPRGDRRVALVLHEARAADPDLEAPMRRVRWLAWDEPALLLGRWNSADHGGHIKYVPVTSCVALAADKAQIGIVSLWPTQRPEWFVPE